MKKSSSSVCALLVVFLVLSHVAVCKAGSDYSNWTVNLSGIMDDANYSWFDYDSLKMVVSGQNVHVVWLSIRTDYGENRLNYRRSTDGGRTFGPVKMLATGVQTQSFSSEWQGLAVDGTTVHVVFTKDSPNGVYYLRSTDNGDTFEAAKAIYSTSWSSYSGLNMAAAGGTVTVAFAANDGNGAQPKDVLCAFSNDGGATFSTTTIAHSDLGHSPIWQFGVGDMVRSGSNIYILYTILDQNIYTTPGHLYLASSNDGGQSFNPSLRVNVKSSDDQYYLNSLQDAHYSPNLAAVGNNVYIIWVNTEVNHFDGTSTRTLRFRRSTDKGVSLEAPVTLSSQTASVLQQGQETVAASGNNVYVATAYKDGSGTYFWRSTDSGGSFDAPKKISDGGWWTTLLTDPADASKLHITNGNYVTSNNDGASFKGVLTLQPDTLGQWRYPVLAVGSDGVVHYAATYNRYDFSTTFDVYYRRLAPAPVPSGPPKVLHLVHDSEFRSDNMQVAASPDINLTSAMTVEFRFRKIADGHLYNYNIIAAKKRAASSGSGTYEFGLWNDGTGHIYTRLVTEGAANQSAGNWMGSGIYAQYDVWYHIAVTYDAAAGEGNWKIYIDGNLANSMTLTGNMVMENLPLVLRGGTGNGYFGAMEMADFRIWNKARTGAEIKADMNRILTGSEAGLTAYYTFANTTRDITGHGNDGIFMYKESFVATMGVLAGQVLNTEGLTSIANATVKATKGADSYTTTTDTNGNFTFAGLPAGDYVIEVVTNAYYSTQGNAKIVIDETTQMTMTGIPQAVVNGIRSGWVTQAQLNQAVADANAAKDSIIDQKNQTIASMFTQQQLNQAVTQERMKWDINNDGKLSLAEVIYILQQMAGLR